MDHGTYQCLTVARENRPMKSARITHLVTAPVADAGINQLLGGRCPGHRPDPPPSGSRGDTRPATSHKLRTKRRSRPGHRLPKPYLGHKTT